MKRAVLYLRVSTTEQTTVNQERELREIAARMGCEVVRVYRDAVAEGVTRLNTRLPLTGKKPNVGTKSGKYSAFFDSSMKPLGCAPYPQTRRHPRTAGGADAPHLCTSKRYDPKADELLLETDAVDVVVKATVARAGQIAAATENSIAEPAPSTAETSAGSSLVHPASCNPCANAIIRACPSGSSVARLMSTPMRRMRSPCCARAVSGHAAAPPSAVSNSRRPRVTVIRPSRARCVNGTIPCHERAVLTARHPAR